VQLHYNIWTMEEKVAWMDRHRALTEWYEEEESALARH
jgi:hypothetical protein